MFFFSTDKPPSATWVAVTRPHFQALCLDTGERVDTDGVLASDGALFIFPNLLLALRDLALVLGRVAPLELYGESIAAGWWRCSKRGVRLAGLQAYHQPAATVEDVAEFWTVICEICERAGTRPGSTPGVTALKIAQALSPERFVAPGRHVQKWARYSFSAGARHAVPGVYKQAYLYDIHSAYPEAMGYDLPFGRWRYGHKEAPFWIARAVIDYQSDLDFSPLWIRGADHKLYHPTEARGVTVILNSIDIQTLEAHGRLRIRKITDRIGFGLKPLLAPVQQFLSAWQDTYPQYRKAIKVMRNAVYGKLVQKDIHSRYILKLIDDRAEARRSGHLFRQYNGYEYGLFKYDQTAYGFCDTPVASAITAAVRSKLYNAIDQNTIAVRTDSVLSTCQRPDLNAGGAVGQWSLQDSGEAVVFGGDGYILHDKPHMDGVQHVEQRVDCYLASTLESPPVDFEENFKRLKEWKIEIERPEHIKAQRARIEIYHSPLASIVRAEPVPRFMETHT